MKNCILVFCILGMCKILTAQTNTFPSSGNVGIGTTNPAVNLDIVGTAETTILIRDTGGARLKLYQQAMDSYLISTNAMQFYTGGYQRLNISANGNVGIGTPPSSEKLSVNGKIRAKEIKVEAINWPDFVFKPLYKLPDLEAIEQFIKVNKHLPEIPSAKEVKENGINLGEMNAKLLQKIEELTLYLIEQNKRQEALLTEVKQLKLEINQLKSKH